MKTKKKYISLRSTHITVINLLNICLNCLIKRNVELFTSNENCKKYCLNYNFKILVIVIALAICITLLVPLAGGGGLS